MYATFYNLSVNPFRLSPDPRLLFHSQTHEKALAYLKYGIQSGEGLVVITGNAGTGKTTLVRYLLTGVDRSRIVAVELTAPRLESGGILHLVAATLGLAYQQLPKSTLLKNIENHLMARARERKRVLLVVDEAQNLTSDALEELRMLSNIQVGERALLQSFLLGQYEFRQQLQSPEMEQFRQRVIASYHLEELSSEETRDYICHRLRLCGWQETPKIMDGVFDQIHNHTSGIPRRINKLCNRLFLYGCVESLHTISEEAAISVIEEENQELHIEENNARDDTCQNHRGSPECPDGINNAHPVHLDNTISNEERRLMSLEKRVAMLEKTVHAEHMRFRRMLMMLSQINEQDEDSSQPSTQSNPGG
jgi:putative secretion ATPase (PEP-CTERM system associated)